MYFTICLPVCLSAPFAGVSKLYGVDPTLCGNVAAGGADITRANAYLVGGDTFVV